MSSERRIREARGFRCPAHGYVVALGENGKLLDFCPGCLRENARGVRMLGMAAQRHMIVGVPEGARDGEKSGPGSVRPFNGEDAG